MGEAVEFENYIYSFVFKGFTCMDYDFFIVLCERLCDKSVRGTRISFEELRKETGYKQTSIDQFVSDLKRMNEKLMENTCDIESENGVLMFALFQTFMIHKKKQLLTVSINEDFRFILNEFTKNLTRSDLGEFVGLGSKYSKNLYRLLKQYRTTGKYQVGIADFREKMDCPESYGNKYVMDLIIKPSLKELQAYFRNLKCTVQYARKQGRPVTGYIFTFTRGSK